MKEKKWFIVFGVLAIILPLTASSHAVLIDNNDGTVTQIRNDGSTLMWLQDAKTAVTTGYCTQEKIDSGACNFNSQMTWYEAQNWITYLNSNNYLGYNDWRLPEVTPVNGMYFNYGISYDGSTDEGWNISAPGSAYEGSTASEFAYLYYYELGNLGYYDLDGNPAQEGWGVKNVGPFVNLTPNPQTYWTGTTYYGNGPGNTSEAWRFSVYEWFETFNGYQEPLCKTCPIHVWAVRSATVVPEPVSSTLFVVGAATLAAWRRRSGRKSTIT